MGKEKNTKEHRCKFCVFIVGAGNTVRVILTEGGRIIITGVNVPCAAWHTVRWVAIFIEFSAVSGVLIQLTVVLRVLCTGEQILPGGSIHLKVTQYIKSNYFAGWNSIEQPEYHPQVREAVDGG